MAWFGRTSHGLDGTLDRLLAGERIGVSSNLVPLVRAAARVRMGLRTEVPARTAAAHLAALEDAAGSPAPARRRIAPPRPPARRLAFVLVTAIVLTLSAAQLAWASADALPGDALYPVKRAVERINLMLHPSAESKGRLHLEFAARRLQEVRTLIEENRTDLLDETVAALDAEADAAISDLAGAGVGHDLAALRAHIEEQLQKHLDRLIFLRDNVVPDQAQKGIQNAIDNASKAVGKILHGREDHQGVEAPQTTVPGKGKAKGKAKQADDDAPGNSGNAPGQGASPPEG